MIGFFVVAGVIVVVTLVRSLPRRRDRLDALEEVAAAAGWEQIRRSLIRLSIDGRWNGRAARLMIVSEDEGDEHDLRTRVDSGTGTRMTIRSRRTTHWWEKPLWALPPIRLVDPSLDAEFAVEGTDGTLANFLFDDPLVMDALRRLIRVGGITITPNHIEIRRRLGDIVISGHDVARLADDARRDLALAARLVERTRRPR